MACYEHINLTLMFQSTYCILFVRTTVYTFWYQYYVDTAMCVYMVSYVNTVWWAGGLYVQLTSKSESVPNLCQFVYEFHAFLEYLIAWIYRSVILADTVRNKMDYSCWTNLIISFMFNIATLLI